MTNPYQSPQPASSSEAMPAGNIALYYGWVIVLVAAVAMAATLPGRTHGLGMITKPLITEFSGGQPDGPLSTVSFAVINFWATIIGALFCIPCGWLLDRFGIKNLVGVVLAGLALVVLWMSFIRDIPSLVVAITLTRGIGQSMLSVVSITMVGKWFRKNLSIAMGVYSVAMGVLFAFGSSLNSRVTIVGWREAWWELGWILLVTSPLAWLATFNRPKNLALEFGPLADSGKIPEAQSEEKFGANLWQALGTPCFWVFAGSISFFGMVSAGFSLFQQYVLEERFQAQIAVDKEFARNVYSSVLFIGFLVGMATNLVCGGLAKIVRQQYLLSIGLALYAIAIGLLPFIQTERGVYLYAVLQGVGGGMMTVLFFAVWGHAFGTRELGRIQGAAQMLTVLASACGPFVIATGKQIGGSYGPVLLGCAGIAATMAIIAPFIPVPNARTANWPADNPASPLALAPESSP